MAYDFLFVLKVIWVSEELLTEQNHSVDLCLQIVFAVWAGKPQDTEQGACEQSRFPALLTYSRVSEP